MLCQPEEIIIIQVRGEMVLNERKRQPDWWEQEVKGIKQVEKNAKES